MKTIMATTRVNNRSRNNQIRQAAAKARAGKKQNGRVPLPPVRLAILDRSRPQNTGPSSIIAKGLPPGMPKRSGAIQKMGHFDARRDGVFGLLRPVGPYTVIRTVTVMSTNSKFSLFCPFIRNDGGVGTDKWFDICSIQAVNSANAINGVLNTAYLPIPGLDSLSATATEIVPAALSVRIANGNALNTTSGMIYLGRSTGNLGYGGSTQTWDALANNLVTTSKTLSVPAARLVLTPHIAHSYPLNFNEFTEWNEPIVSSVEFNPFTWSDERIKPAALAPLWVYNPSAVQLDYTVTMQWRVRLDVSNPLVSDHKEFPLSSIGEMFGAVAAMARAYTAWMPEAQTVAETAAVAVAG